MKIHEYQAKELFRKFSIPVPFGKVAFTPAEAKSVAEELKNDGSSVFVVKAQIHAGGRGKGGGVKVTKSLEEAQKAAEDIIGMQLITHQTGPEGKKVKSVLVEQGSDIDRELYLSIVMDRGQSTFMVMASPDGGMDIEEVAEKTPERILKVAIHPSLGLQGFQARQIAYFLSITKEAMKEALTLITNLYKMMQATDAEMVEINPLVLTKDNRVFALDAKVNFDSNALYRQKEIMEYRDIDEEDPLEVEASKYGLNYIKLDGNVGCMVNGAGLAMASMDIIKLAGAEPANFLDVGGSADEEGLENAFRIILSDDTVQAVLINIFGGILRCDLLANGVVKAAQKLDVKVPIVIRMKGTNVQEGKRILAESPLTFEVAETIKEAADKVASLVKQPVKA